MKSPLLSLLPTLALAILLSIGTVSGQGQLSPDQIESLKKRLETIKENLDNHLSSRNSSAGGVFLTASADPRAAVDLYLKCVSKVDFEQEGRKESEFREWKDGQADRLRDKRFVESLMLQLRYLGISCKVAEMEDPGQAFNDMMSFADSLSRMEDLPTDALTQSCAGSVFAKAYNLESLLGSNEGWEPVPYNIAGIYEKAIFPYLRRENPSSLMNAWDKRIAQQTQLAANLASKVEEIERDVRNAEGNERRKSQDILNRFYGRDGSKMAGSHDKDDFVRETLPRLKWERLKDMYVWVDEVAAAQDMLSFVEEHVQHELGEEFYNDFAGLIANAGVGSNRIEESTGESN